MTMDDLIEAIRAACASDASDDIKERGAQACRTILTALDAKAGEPLAALTPTPTEPAASAETVPAGAQIAALVGALKGVPPEQLLDMAIARLRAALPKDTSAPVVAPVRFQIIPIAPIAATVRSTEASKS
jgi:hypothetical protein